MNMNTRAVTLTIVLGPLQGHEYVFEDGEWCMIGRAEDCDLRLPSDAEHDSVSRHHCVLEIEEPTVRLRDLGSRNGTFLNGENIGQRRSDEFLEEADILRFETRELHDGDLIRVGYTLVRVHIVPTISNPAESSRALASMVGA